MIQSNYSLQIWCCIWYQYLRSYTRCELHKKCVRLEVLVHVFTNIYHLPTYNFYNTSLLLSCINFPGKPHSDHKTNAFVPSPPPLFFSLCHRVKDGAYIGELASWRIWIRCWRGDEGGSAEAAWTENRGSFTKWNYTFHESLGHRKVCVCIILALQHMMIFSRIRKMSCL